MQVIHDGIRLDPTVPSVEVVDEDWAINPAQHCLQHEPTRTVFRIGVDENKTEGQPVTVLDFSAHLVAIGEGCALPSASEIETLGRAAIALYLVAFGYLRPGAPDAAPMPNGAAAVYDC